MWIPYGLLGPLKAESAPETVRNSAEDTNEREFLVGFFVRNPVTQVWEVDILLNNGTYSETLNFHGRPAVMNLFPNDAGKLDEILYRIEACSAQQAVDACYAHVTTQLASWALRLGRGMAVAGWRVADLKHETRWRCVPFRPSALELKQPTLDQVPDTHRHLLHLYGEVRNATSPAWRLLNAMTILRAWRDRAEPFGSTDQRASEVGQSRREHLVTFETLMHSGAGSSASDLRDKPLAELIQRLEPVCRKVIRALEGERDAYSVPTRAEAAQLAEFANLADACAREVLTGELTLLQATEEAKRLEHV